MNANQIKQLADDVIVEVLERFLDRSAVKAKRNVEEIARQVSALKGLTLKREDIYACIAEARRRGFLKIIPPTEIHLAQRILDFHRLHEREIGEKLGQRQVQVVSAELEVRAATSERERPGPAVADRVALQAAIAAIGAIKNVARVTGRKEVHVGLASGYTSMAVVRHIADLLRVEVDMPDLVFHSLSGGYAVDEPEKASVTFVTMFSGLPKKPGFVGLFAPPFVPTGQYDANLELPGVKEAFDRRGQIDVIVTALASRDDDHGELRTFISAGAERSRTSAFLAALEQLGWEGDLQYRPYSAERFLDLNEAQVPYSSVTLFSLEELVDFAGHPEKAVILVGAPCPRCGRHRARALLPLLKSRSLQVWSHIILDKWTASLLVGPAMST